MTVASPELCKELYEISHWRPERCWFWVTTDQQQTILVDSPFAGGEYPAYTLGYLLRKLPEGTVLRRNKNNPRKRSNWHGEWFVGIYGYRFNQVGQHGDTPEDALARVCIELFKQGILTR